jgi:hypothetical protein
VKTAIACCDRVTRTVWLLPIEALEKKVIRLGKNYDRYIIPEPTSKAYLEQKEIRRQKHQSIVDQAKAAVEKVTSMAKLDPKEDKE